MALLNVMTDRAFPTQGSVITGNFSIIIIIIIIKI